MDRIKLVRSAVKTLGLVSPSVAAEIALRLFTTPQKIARPNWEKEIVAHGKRVEFENGIKGTSWGEVGQPIVVLLHGWQGRGSQLATLVEPLLASGYCVIAVDGPAHGDSDGTRTNVWFFSLAISEVGKQLGHLKAVVAHSFGASATAFAVSRGMDVERVVLVASPSDLMWVIDGFCKEMQFSKRVTDAFLKKLVSWSGVDPKTITIANVGNKVNIPALIVHDPEDREVPFSNAETIVRHWKSATLLPLEKVGHRKVLKAPVFVKAVTEFLGPAVASKQDSV